MDRRRLLLAPLSLFLARAAAAHSLTQGAIEIGHPWAKPSVGENAAMFLALANNGPRADRLLGGTTPVADAVIIRAADGSPLEYLDLFPRRPVALRPGGRYIALRGLKQPLAIDDSFPVTLRFAVAGIAVLTVIVAEGPEEGG